MSIYPLFSLLFFLFSIQNVLGYRYLMVSLNIAYSHLEFNGRVADLLVDRGHEVTFLLAKINPFATNNGTQKANIIPFVPSNLVEIGELIGQLPVYDNVFEEEVDVFSPRALPYFKKAAHLFCFALQTDSQLLAQLQQHEYDAALIEDDSCFKVLARRLDIRNLMMLTPTALSESHANAMSLPMLASFVPVLNYSPVSPLQMSFLERLWNFYHTMRSIYVVDPQLNELFDEPGSLRGPILSLDFPKITELNKDITAWFVNTYRYSDLPRPLSPVLHHVGGIAMGEQGGDDDGRELSEPLLRIYSQARKGVVLVSFGSVVDTQKIDLSILDYFVQAFRRFKDYQFVWKFNLKTEEERKRVFGEESGNVHLVEWLNQKAMLAHPLTRLFVSHVGLNSLNEALNSGVPLLALPLFCDQTYNAAIVEHLGVGLVLNKRELSVDVLVDGLERVLEKREFREKTKRIREMVREEQEKVSERFIQQVEQSTRFADQIKRQNLPQLNPFIYYSVDVLLFLLSLFLLVSICAGCLLWEVWGLIVRRVKAKKE